MLEKIFKSLTDDIVKKCSNQTIDSISIEVWDFLFSLMRAQIYKNRIPKNIKKNLSSNIILTMTTCKRCDLFTETINSIFMYWKDIQIVDKFFVVDDCSSDSDRNFMRSSYPFIEFYMKDVKEKGHKESMNIIYHYLKDLEAAYWIHIEDDMLFFYEYAYISTGIQGLNTLTNFNIKQILFNRNYCEIMSQINYPGHIPIPGTVFALHNYTPRGQHSTYWPYFSLRPSVCDFQSILKLGEFGNKENSLDVFFEMEYARRFMNHGYKSAFFNFISHYHTGRLACNKTGNNAYILNNVPQFSVDELKLNIVVINLERRPDRLDTITKTLTSRKLRFLRKEAVDGTKPIDIIQYKMFDGNDFGYRQGVIGCALSHYNIWKDLVNSEDNYTIVIEDDCELIENCKYIFNKFINDIETKDIIMFGYHHNNKELNINNKEHIKDKSKEFSLNDYRIVPIDKTIYYGGTHCYSITKEGAKKMLNYIKISGIKHGIDYLMVKIQKTCDVYMCDPQIAYADFVGKVAATEFADTDIQYNHNSVHCHDEKCDIDDFIFIKGLDQIGFDIHSIQLTREEIIGYCSKVPCVAFNTLGFFKEKITELTPSPYYKEDDGIYIKKDYYFNVFKKKE